MNALGSSAIRKPRAVPGKPRMVRWVVRGLAVLVALSVLLVAVAWGYDTYTSARVTTLYPPPGQFVQVGDAKMHFACQGSGEPTLVLEAGLPGGVLDWTPVMPTLAAHHRVCAFDRLGQDWSDPAPYPRTFGTAADELHAALQQLGIARPVVVGHSVGGALVQIYAAKYDVAGVVLVDGVTSGVVDATAERLGSNTKWDGFARLGLMRPVMRVLVTNPAYPPTTRDVMTALRSRSSAWLNMSDEDALAQQSMAVELRAAERKLTMPLLIIAAGQSNVMGIGVGAFAQSAKALADRTPTATYVLVPGAKHDVHAEQPQVVSDAIETWLTTVK
jgi:pimeloyl-ACP methyl ester carboxylesterase